MTEIDEIKIRRLSELARLDLTEQEVTLYSRQIEKILGYVKQLEEVAVEGVEPMVNPFDSNLDLRPDVPMSFSTNAQGKPKCLDPAPETLYDGFRVPQIL